MGAAAAGDCLGWVAVAADISAVLDRTSRVAVFETMATTLGCNIFGVGKRMTFGVYFGHFDSL